jgi:RAB protein geranylgeranyltransferase component A
MYKDLENSQYDYVIFGTSLCESILSSYLSKSGKKVIHFDVSKYYGGDCKNFSYKDLDNCIK